MLLKNMAIKLAQELYNSFQTIILFSRVVSKFYFIVNRLRLTTEVPEIKRRDRFKSGKMKLLPLLPRGSKYTGVDAGALLIKHAKEIYQDSPYETEFILGDVQTILFEQKYDLVVCHAFLMHVPNPKEILQKMINSVVDQGRIVCFESNWIANMANYYYDGMDQSTVIQLGLLQKLYELDAKREGKDGNIGIKIPI